jgi:hypothetical protein
MDCEYQYIFVGHSDHYDFLSHNAGECSDPFLEKGIGKFVDNSEGSLKDNPCLIAKGPRNRTPWTEITFFKERSTQNLTQQSEFSP